MDGQVGENFLNETYGGTQQVYRRTPKGGRYIDNLVDGIAMESKVGRTSLTKAIRKQIEKDIELMKDASSGIKSVEWHFFPSCTGVGPTKPLRDLLEESGIKIVIHSS